MTQNLYITYSNQKKRELQNNVSNPFDKVVTLQQLCNEIFEKNSFKTIINQMVVTSLLYKIIVEEKIDYFDFISSNSDTLELIYDFILKVNGSDIEFEDILDEEKLEAIKTLHNSYQKFKVDNNFVDENDINMVTLELLDKNYFSSYSEVFLDNFEVENIKFYKSNLELKILHILQSFSTPYRNNLKNHSAKLFKLSKKPFDINDEVQSALKLARKLLEDDDTLTSQDICIITTDISEYAPIFRLYLANYDLKGYDSKGEPLALYSKNNSDARIKNAFIDIEREVDETLNICKKYDISIDKLKLKEKLLQNSFVLQDKVGFELTEANQLVGLNTTYKHIIFIGTDINHFPPKSSDNFLYTSQIAQTYFCQNNYYKASLYQYNELKRLAQNLYIINANYKEKRELTPSIIIDKNIPNKIDISNIKPKKEKITNQPYLDSILSHDFTMFDGLEVNGVKASHLSASQLGSYAKCPLKYLYTYKLKLQAPSQSEDGFDASEKGTLMHSCFEQFAKKVQGNTSLLKDDFRKIMVGVLDTEYQKYLIEQNIISEDENIYHTLFKYDLAKGLDGGDDLGVLSKFIEYYEEQKEELNYFSNSEFEKEFALDGELKSYTIKDENDKNYFIKGYIDRFDNLKDQINIVDYKSKKASGVSSSKLEEIEQFKDFQLGLYMLYAKQGQPNKDIDAHLLTFNTGVQDKISTKFATISNNEEIIPIYRNKATGVLYDEKYEKNLKENIYKIKELIEKGDFRFDNSDEEVCKYCDVKFLCHGGVLSKGVEID